MVKTEFDEEYSITGFDQHSMLQPKQNLVAMMHYLDQKFSRSSLLVLDPGLGIGATAKACPLEL